MSAAAQAAVGGLCWWCGYGGSLRSLVAANADYVVDGMCAQLRQVGPTQCALGDACLVGGGGPSTYACDTLQDSM